MQEQNKELQKRLRRAILDQPNRWQKVTDTVRQYLAGFTDREKSPDLLHAIDRAKYDQLQDPATLAYILAEELEKHKGGK